MTEITGTIAPKYPKQGDIQKAEKVYVFIQKAIPNLLKPYYLLAMLYYNIGDKKTFIIKATEALDFEPKINNAEVMEMKQELNNLLDNL